MSFNFEDLLVDENKVIGGVRLELGETGGWIMAAMPFGPKFTAEEVRLEREYADKMKWAKSEEEKNKIKGEKAGKLWFRTVFLGWGGLKIKAGDEKEFAHTEENCITLFTELKYTRVAGLLVGAVNSAVERGDFNEIQITRAEAEGVVKKSQK